MILVEGVAKLANAETMRGADEKHVVASSSVCRFKSCLPPPKIKRFWAT